MLNFSIATGLRTHSIPHLLKFLTKAALLNFFLEKARIVSPRTCPLHTCLGSDDLGLNMVGSAISRSFIRIKDLYRNIVVVIQRNNWSFHVLFCYLVLLTVWWSLTVLVKLFNTVNRFMSLEFGRLLPRPLNGNFLVKIYFYFRWWLSLEFRSFLGFLRHFVIILVLLLNMTYLNIFRVTKQIHLIEICSYRWWRLFS